MAQQDGLEKLEDSDVKDERFRVEHMEFNSGTFASFPLIVDNIRKVYANGKIANKAMCLAVEKNIVFGLLGPVILLHMHTQIVPSHVLERCWKIYADPNDDRLVSTNIRNSLRGRL